MSQKKYNNKSKNVEIAESVAVPMILILAVIPLMVFARKIDTGLSGEAWYANSTSTYDIFLFYKARFIALVGVVAAGILGYTFYKRYNIAKKNLIRKGVYHGDFRRIECPLGFFVPAGIYFLFALISTFASNDVGRAFWGGMEQFEGMSVIFGYVVLACYGYYMIRAVANVSRLIDLILKGAAVGSCILCGIGAFQFFALDFFRTDIGQFLITMFDNDLRGQSLTFNFEANRTYTSLYNPNYVGTYVALLLPVVIAALYVCKESWVKVVSTATMIFMVFSLVGSESFTGGIALGAMAIFFFFMMLRYVKRYIKQVLVFAGGCVLLIAAFTFIKPDVVQYGLDKVFRPVSNDYQITGVCNEKSKGLRIDTNQFVMYAKMTDTGMAFEREDGKALNVKYYSTNKAYTVQEEGMACMTFYVSSYGVQKTGTSLRGFRLACQNREWNFVLDGENYKFFTSYSKLDDAKEIDSIGFKYSQHFASRRGFIWSRTLPLLKDNLIIGAGPDAFVFEFPNDDYIGMENNGYGGNMVTKPHNMYLQIATQTGMISLIAFLVMYLFYLIQSIRLYHTRTQGNPLYIVGQGIMYGSFGYMIAGFANDSTITVAPIFWLLMGVGLGINTVIKINEKKSESSKN